LPVKLRVELATVVNFEQIPFANERMLDRGAGSKRAGPSIQLRQVSERGQRPGTWAELKEVGSWMQDTYIESGRATFPGMTAPDRGVAQACANLRTALLG